MSHLQRVAFVAISFSMLSGSLQQSEAANLGQWDGSGRTWNGSEFTSIKATLTSAGHVVEADSALTAANLANDQVLLFGEPTRDLTLAEQSDLDTWVNAGGVLLVMVDSGEDDFPQANNILSGLGTSLSFDLANSGVAGPIQAGNYAASSVFDLVGLTPEISPGHGVNIGAGSSHVSDNILGVQAVGNGYVFAFGDRFDHNFASPSDSNTNGQLFLNIANRIPEPASLVLVVAGCVIVCTSRRLSR